MIFPFLHTSTIPTVMPLLNEGRGFQPTKTFSQCPDVPYYSYRYIREDQDKSD